MRIILAGIVGLLAGGLSSALVVAAGGATFHWEMAVLIVPLLSSLVGGCTGALVGAGCARLRVTTSMRGLIGLLGGTILGLVAGIAVVSGSSARSPGAPAGLAFWSVVAIAVGGGIAGWIGGVMAQARPRTR